MNGTTRVDIGRPLHRLKQQKRANTRENTTTHIPTAITATAPELKWEPGLPEDRAGVCVGEEGLDVVVPGSPSVVLVAVEGTFTGEDWVAMVLG